MTITHPQRGVYLPDYGYGVAGPDPVLYGLGQVGVEVAVVENGNAHRVQLHAPLARLGVLHQVLQQELFSDVLKPRQEINSNCLESNQGKISGQRKEKNLTFTFSNNRHFYLIMYNFERGKSGILLLMTDKLQLL